MRGALGGPMAVRALTCLSTVLLSSRCFPSLSPVAEVQVRDGRSEVDCCEAHSKQTAPGAMFVSLSLHHQVKPLRGIAAQSHPTSSWRWGSFSVALTYRMTLPAALQAE
jgi:hypothetical protein